MTPQSVLHNLKNNPLDVTIRFLIYSLFFSIIIQTGKYFWPDFSFVLGVRVDYLAPTLYFSDIIVFLLLIVQLVEWIRLKNFRPLLTLIAIGVFLSFCIPFVEMPWAHLWGIVTALKWTFVGYVVAKNFRTSSVIPLLYILSFGVLVESLLSFGQFFLQSSILGPFYYLGERAIVSTSFGAATFSIFGSELLRPYGTFPHPNLLAFFLLFSLVMLIYCREKYKDRIFDISIALGSISLLITFSRASIAVFVTVMLYYFFSRKKRYWDALLLFISGLYIVIFLPRFSLDSIVVDWSYRKELFTISLEALSGSYLFGTGLLNYFQLQAPLYRTISPTFLQPVHNIYMLVFVQFGIVGCVVIFYLLWKTVKRAFKNARSGECFDKALFAILCSALLIGVFDHFFLTLQQGQMMGAIILGLIWRKTRIKNSEL